MTTAYSNLLGLALPVTGELSGTWGDTVNDYITKYLDDAIANAQIISGSQTAVTLSKTTGASLVSAGSGATGSAQYALIRCTGNPASTLTITVDYSSLTNAQFSKTYLIFNSTSTSQSVVVRATTSSGTSTGVTITSGEKALIAWNGTDFVKIATQSGTGEFVTVDTTNLEVTNIKAKDGTAAATIADSTGAITVSTILNVDNLRLDTNTISSTDTNGNIVLAPNGNGDVQLDADTVRVGDSNVNVTITSNGTADLILNTNAGTNSGSITIEDGANGNIIIAPNGTGQVQISNAALDLTTIEVTNIKAKDGTASMTLADSTGVVTFSKATVIETTDNTNAALRITQLGTGNALLVEDSANPDTTPFVVTATGDVGIGTSSPATKLHVSSSGSTEIRVSNTGISLNAAFAAGSAGVDFGTSTNHPIDFYTNSSLRMKLDTSGNLGLGVTPSAWRSTNKALQVAQSASLFGYTASNIAALGNNVFINSAGDELYINDGTAAYYRQNGNAHEWYRAASGTANSAVVAASTSYTVVALGTTTLAEWQASFSGLSAIPTLGQVLTSLSSPVSPIPNGGLVTQNISFTQAMTLDASGNLGIGETNPSTILNLKQSTGPIVRLVRTSNRFELSADNDFMSLNARDASTYINFKTEDTERGRFSSDGTFRVKGAGTAGSTDAVQFSGSAPASAMTLDSSGNLVVGATSGSRRITARYDASTVYSASSMESLCINTYAINADTTIGSYTGIQFTAGNNSDSAIVGIRTADGSAALAFGTRNAGSGAIVERARIDSSGNLLVGTTSASGILASGGRGYIEVNGTSDSAIGFESNNTLGGYLYNQATEFRVANYSNNPLTFHTNNTEKARITSVGGFETRPVATGHAVFNEDGVDADFRVEGDTDTHLIFADASTDRVGIGTNNPAVKLDTQAAVTGTYNSTTQQIVARFFNSPADLGSGVNSAFITLQTTPDGGGFNPVARVGVVAESYGSNNGAFVVATRDASSVSEKMRLDSSGNLGLGVTTPSPWSSGKAVEINTVGNGVWGASQTQTFLTSNVFYNSGFKFGGTGYATALALDGGDFYFYTSNASGSAGGSVTWTNTNTAAMTLNSSGNLGLGVTPSAWNSFIKALQVGSAYSLALVAEGDDSSITTNAYKNASSQWVLQTSSSYKPTRYNQYLGKHIWSYGVAGSANAAASFTEAMTLDASGNLLVGATSNAAITGFSGSATGQAIQGGLPVLALVDSDDTTNYVTWLANSGGTTYLYSKHSSSPLIFGTANAERARITSGGYFKASNDGNYSGVSNTYHELYQTANSTSLLVRATNGSYTASVLEVNGDRSTTNATYNLINAYNGSVSGQFIVRDSGNVVNTNNSYGAISDVKMKVDIVDAGSQWSDIKAIRFRKFKMKSDPKQVVQLGVVAQELEQTSPGLVEEHADRDGEGNDLGTTTKSVKTSVLLMKAAVALQEAMARIEKLEAEVAALKGA